jgi:hypothetical protein
MECKPSTYNVITGKDTITYGFRCAVHKIHTRRYATEELRDRRLAEHQRDAKKGAKKS